MKYIFIVTPKALVPNRKEKQRSLRSPDGENEKIRTFGMKSIYRFQKSSMTIFSPCILAAQPLFCYKDGTMNTVVVYRSISGFTKKYAEWIAEELSAECIEISAFGDYKISEDSIVIFGGSLHAVGINGYKKFKKIMTGKTVKAVIVFAVGASPKKAGIEEEVRRNNLTDKEEENIPLYYLRGGFDYGKLNMSNKILMGLLRIKLLTNKNKTPEDRGIQAAYKKPLDAAKRENLRELLEYVRKIEL